MSSTGRRSNPPLLLTSSRQISWASCADRLLSATGPVSERQYPIRIGVVELAMLSASFLMSIEKLKFPGQGDSAGPAMLKNDGSKGIGGLLARPIPLPLAQYGHPVNWHHTGLNHTAHCHIVGFH